LLPLLLLLLLLLLLCCRYAGSQGIYTHTVAYERNEQCPVCSPGVELNAPASSTLQQVRVGMGV
jgi:hypothetical protein